MAERALPSHGPVAVAPRVGQYGALPPLATGVARVAANGGLPRAVDGDAPFRRGVGRLPVEERGIP